MHDSQLPRLIAPHKFGEGRGRGGQGPKAGEGGAFFPAYSKAALCKLQQQGDTVRGKHVGG